MVTTVRTTEVITMARDKLRMSLPLLDQTLTQMLTMVSCLFISYYYFILLLSGYWGGYYRPYYYGYYWGK